MDSFTDRDILRLRDLEPGTIFQTIGNPPRRAVTTRFKDDITVLCVEIDRFPGNLEAMVGAMPVQELDTTAAAKDTP